MIEVDCRKCQNLQTVPGVHHIGKLTARCKCYGPADKAPARCAADAFKYYYPMRTPDEYKPGMAVWCLERDEDGNACDVAGYVYLATVAHAVILTPYINDLEELFALLDYHIERTAEVYDTDLAVFHACDCYPAQSLAEAALAKEMEG